MGDEKMEKKIGVYICEGCDIGENLDMAKLQDIATKEYKVPIVKTHGAFCSPDGVDLIKKDIQDDGVNTVVVAACSHRIFYDVFDFGSDKITERVNLREQVVWSHPVPKEETESAKSSEENAGEGETDTSGVDEDTQMLAEDYIRMGIVKVQKKDIPTPYQFEEEFVKNIMVIGGGLTGMTAALEAAETGYPVTIVERQKELGGFAKKIRQQLPMKSPFNALEEPTIQGLIDKVSSHDNITIKTNIEIARISGSPGQFLVSFKDPGSKTEWDVPPKAEEEKACGTDTKDASSEPSEPAADQINCADILSVDPDAEKFGAVVVAAGWRPYEPSEGEFKHLGLGKFKNVVTNVQFEEMAAKGRVEAKSVAFIQSPGQDSDDSDFPYCSSVTSLVSLKQAQYVTRDNPGGKAYVFYQHMRTPGLYENFYKTAQQNDAVFLTKGAVTGVGASDNGDELFVSVDNTLLGEPIKVSVDMVVLATGMVPATQFEPVINLAYRQGPEFKDLELFGGYCDSNFICFPYETRRTGVYAAGCVRQTMTMADCVEDATGAALKAIQCLESTNRGMAVHPRSGDVGYPEFFFQRCTQCKRCTEECPFGALDDDEKGTPKPNITRCRRCGTCMGACPERIVSFKDYSIDMIGSMVKAIEVPDEEEEKYRVLCLVCENDAYPAIDMAGMKGLKYSADVRFIQVRCLGSVNVVWIADAFASGFDGVLLIGCKYGDDYQCHFTKGSELCNRRMDNVGETLQRLALESERVQQIQLSIDEYDKIPEEINKFMEVMDSVGFNPMKGF